MKQNDLSGTEPDLQDPDELVRMLDGLFAAGTQHVNLESGAQTVIRSVGSTDCSGKPGACAVPNFDYIDAEPEEPASER